MTGLEIAALVAAITGAGMQYKASSDAQDRQRKQIALSLSNQDKLNQQAEKKALDRAAEYETPKRQGEQAQLEEEITNRLATPVSESQAIRSQQQTTQGNVSKDYEATKAARDVQSVKDMEVLARLLGKTTSASRLRMNEGIRLMDTGQELGMLGGFSRGQAGADQIAIDHAGQLDPTKMFVGSLLQTAGTAGLSAGGSSLSSSGAAAKYGSGEGSQQSAMLAAQEAGMGTGSAWNSVGSFRDGYNNFMRGFQ